MPDQPTHDPLTIMLTVTDPRATIAFYREKLGFELEACWPSEQDPKWANLLMGRQAVMIGALMSGADAKAMCGGNEGAARYMETLEREFRGNRPGVGVVIYVQVPDVDAYHRQVTGRGVNASPPTSQFYGLREFGVQDPQGYRYLFYTPIAMEECQSCGMPLKDATPGQMYCSHCTDEKGQLKPWETVLAGTAGYFEHAQKLPREQALAAATKHLQSKPAWAGRG